MSKKFNLREFQTRLSQQLQAAANRDTSGSRLGFRVGDANWLVSSYNTMVSLSETAVRMSR